MPFPTLKTAASALSLLNPPTALKNAGKPVIALLWDNED